MEKNKLIGIGVIAILAVAGVIVAMHFLSLENGETLLDPPGGLPEGDAPEGALILNDIEGNPVAEIPMATLVELLRNETIPLVECNSTENRAGFNPLDLFHYYGLNFVNEFELVASDGNSGIINYETFYMGDPNYYRDAIQEYTMIALAINGTWLNELNEDWGNLHAFGDSLAISQKMGDIVNITVESELLVSVYIDDTLEFYLSADNMTDTTTFAFNYTTYDWSYKCNASGTSWAGLDLEGTTITSIAEQAGLLGEYNVSFISVDGWGARWEYNQTQMEEGITHQQINDPPEPFDNEGKQTMLNIAGEGDYLNYEEGPFRIVMPGDFRNRYQKAVTEIRFTTG